MLKLFRFIKNLFYKKKKLIYSDFYDDLYEDDLEL